MAVLLAVTAVVRLAGVVANNWTSYGGELFINFPGYLVLEWLNPGLHAAVPGGFGFDGEQWFYGPFHHIAYLPLLTVMASVPSFFQVLLVSYIVAICAALAAMIRVEDVRSSKYTLLFLCLALGLTFNQFAVLDNLRQRNSELLEFILLLVALRALKRNREETGGSLLALAGLTKLLPAVFFIALPVKRMGRAVIAYLVTTLIVVVLTQVLLGWENYALFQPRIATQHGLPTLDAIRGEEPITEPSVQRGSFYTSLLLPYYAITFTSDESTPTIRRTAGSLLVPNIGFVVAVLIIGVITAVAVARSGNDWLFVFGLLGTLMLIASPRCNPHYYVFPLFGFFWFARRFLERQQVGQIGGVDAWIAIFLFVLMLMFGFLVPFSIVDRIFGLPAGTYFHMLAVYGIQGVATFLLWCLLVFTRFRLDVKAFATEQRVVSSHESGGAELNHGV